MVVESGGGGDGYLQGACIELFGEGWWLLLAKLQPLMDRRGRWGGLTMLAVCCNKTFAQLPLLPPKPVLVQRAFCVGTAGGAMVLGHVALRCSPHRKLPLCRRLLLLVVDSASMNVPADPKESSETWTRRRVESWLDDPVRSKIMASWREPNDTRHMLEADVLLMAPPCSFVRHFLGGLKTECIDTVLLPSELDDSSAGPRFNALLSLLLLPLLLVNIDMLQDDGEWERVDMVSLAVICCKFDVVEEYNAMPQEGKRKALEK